MGPIGSGDSGDSPEATSLEPAIPPLVPPLRLDRAALQSVWLW